MPEQTYTYRNGEKVYLDKSPDQFVTYAPLGAIDGLESIGAEAVTPNATRVTTDPSALDTQMDLSRDAAVTHHAYYLSETGEEFLISDRIFVSFREEMTAAQVDAFAAKYALIQLEAYSEMDYLFQLSANTGMNPVKLVVKLMEKEPVVALADHDLNRRVSTYQALALPTDPNYLQQWHLHEKLSHNDFDPRASARCEGAWQLLGNFGNPDVVIGVTDDGCKLDHADFDSPNKFAGWGYFKGNRLVTNSDIDANPSEMYQTGSNHGTSCAGVIAAEVDSQLTVGAAPGCRLLPIKWESSGSGLFISDSKLLAAINFLAGKVDVISNSWGSVPHNTWAPAVVNRIKELAKTGGRRGKGIVFLWAAGNENCPIQHTGTAEIPYTNGWQIKPDGSPQWVGVKTSKVFRNNLVGVPGVLHVAALASTAQRSHYSNYGIGIGLTAPTNNVHKYWRMAVHGLGITTTTGSGGGLTTSFGGTSSATPLVAGVCGLILSANPGLTAEEVIAILKQTASKDLDMTGYAKTPAASYDPNPSWDISPVMPFDSGAFTDIGSADGTWSPWFGHGRVDAVASVAEALARQATLTANQVKKSSAPALAIPDKDASGVRDTINIPQSGSLATITIDVDITHPYIGDLVVTLLSPTSQSIELHKRSGGNTDNLIRTYDAVSTPMLGSLAGKDVKGDWTLWVQDLATRDTGKLSRWGLEIEYHKLKIVELDEAPGVDIPDNQPAGILRTLKTEASGNLAELEISLDLTHTYIGDLLIELIPPASPPVTLHKRTGGNKDNLIQTYTFANTPALTALKGATIKGDWMLKVADLAGRDVGKLNSWGVHIKKG
jgi:subtilisin-like proprotein convertase family protein/subtilisin family serine protease